MKSHLKSKIKRNTNYDLKVTGILDIDDVFDNFADLDIQMLSKSEPTEHDLLTLITQEKEHGIV